MFAQSRLSIGIGFGNHGSGAYPPPAFAQYQPPCPAPGYNTAARYVEPRDHDAYRGHVRNWDRESVAWNHGDERHDNRGARDRDYRR